MIHHTGVANPCQHIRDRIRHDQFGCTPLPACLDDARTPALVGVGPEADAAHIEAPHITAGAAAHAAAIDPTGAVLRRTLGLGDHRLLCHVFTSFTPPGRACPARTKAPWLPRRSRPSSR